MFDYLYELVSKAENFKSVEKKLETFQLNGTHIDATKVGKPYITVAAQLALDGKFEQVEWLRRYGANPSHIVRAYAQAGYDDKVKEYFDKYDVAFEDIAEGYALAGNDKKVEEYRQKYHTDVDNIAYAYAQAKNDQKVNEYRDIHHASVVAIVEGYALAGSDTKVEEYRKNYKIGLNPIARSYARAGNDKKVEEYFDLGAEINAIAEGYALSGNDEKVDEYCIGADINVIASSYAEIGRHDKVDRCRMFDCADVNKIAYAYARVGTHHKVEEYRKYHKASVDLIAEGYKEGCYFKKVKEYCDLYGAKVELNSSWDSSSSSSIQDDEKFKDELDQILENYKTIRTSERDSSGKTKKYLHGNFFGIFQKSFKQKCQAIEALKNALDNQNVNLMDHLSTLRNGNLGKKLREFVKAGKADPLVDESVDTVSEFVQALQNKIALNAFHKEG
jgi:hypothetical protein